MGAPCDDILDEFLAPGEGEFVQSFAGPFTLQVIIGASWACPMRTGPSCSHGSRAAPTAAGSVTEKTLAKTPLGHLYEVFAEYVEDEIGASPVTMCLTGLATATFPDGTMPEVADVVQVALGTSSPPARTTVRLLSTALKVMGDQPDIQQRLREDRSLLPDFIEMPAYRARSRATSGCRGRRPPSATKPWVPVCTVMVVNGASPATRGVGSRTPIRSTPSARTRQHLAFGRGIHSCPGAPLARAETRVGLERLLDLTTDIRIQRSASRAGRKPSLPVHPDVHPARAHQILHLEFDLADGAS